MKPQELLGHGDLESAALTSLTRSLIRHAHAIAREVGARVVLLYADVVEADEVLADMIRDVGFRLILVSRRSDFRPPAGWEELCSMVSVPDVPMTRAGQVKMATLVAMVEGLIQEGDRIVLLTGIQGSNTIDTILVLDLGRELELFRSVTANPLPSDVRPAVFERVLMLAGELGHEGREGRPVGALFVLGDSDAVLSQSRQLVINPFHGYPESERNVLDPRLEETIKEFSSLDGAFVIRGDGVILSAARYLVPPDKPTEPLPSGLGARHEAAAGITASSDAVALCISESTGSVSIFRRGRLITDIRKPRSRGPDDL
jgi:DNA integrity scanning protein DisA with diadenylate cyclase activity